MVQRTITFPEAEARRLLKQAASNFSAYGERWPGYEVDVALLAGLVLDLGVQPVPDLIVGNREYAAFLKADSKLIVVEANHHEHRRRFSIAHEIGHYILHYPSQIAAQTNFHCSLGDMEVSDVTAHVRAAVIHRHLRQEWEANLFAGELLMPEGPVIAMFKVTGGSIVRLAKNFQVSPQAMEIRLKRLTLPFAPRQR